MKKPSKLGKTLIITVIIATFLITCGIVVYAVGGNYFTDYHSKATDGNNILTKWDWNDVLDKLEPSNRNGRMYPGFNVNDCCEYNGIDPGIQCTCDN